MFLRMHAGGGRLRACGLLLAATVGCAWPAWAQFGAGAPEGAATITSMTGRVDVMRDSIPYVLNSGDWVKPGQMVVTGPDGWALFKLPDGSTFEVFANAHVVFRASPGNWTDLLDVLLGKIVVHIQKLNGQPNHNRVRTPTAVISVRGTIFDVNVEDDGDTTFVMVEEGLVYVEHVLLRTGKGIPLAPGQSIRVYKNVPLAQSNIDKGTVMQEVARGLARALYEVMLGRQRGGSAGSSIPTSTGGGSVGDTKAPTPPPPPPPGPPPPPPPQ